MHSIAPEMVLDFIIKNRLFYLSNIIESFLSLVSKSKGELKAKLISSKKLSTEEQKKIQSELDQADYISVDVKGPFKSDSYRY